MNRFIAVVMLALIPFVMLEIFIVGNQQIKKITMYKQSGFSNEQMKNIMYQKIKNIIMYEPDGGTIYTGSGNDSDYMISVERDGIFKIKQVVYRSVICPTHGEIYVVAFSEGDDGNCLICKKKAFKGKTSFCFSCDCFSEPIIIGSTEDNGKCKICSKLY